MNNSRSNKKTHRETLVVVENKHSARSKPKIEVLKASSSVAANMSKPRQRRQPTHNKADPSNRDSLLVSYARTLEDPFEYPPVPLGYDCFVDTETVEAYRQTTLTVNADGSFAYALFPDANGLFQNVAGLAVATWTSSGFTDTTSISASYGAGRFVSAGIRAVPMVADTTTPGLIYAGIIPSITRGAFASLTPQNLIDLPQSEVALSFNGAKAVTRPTSNKAYEFSEQTCGVFGSGTLHGTTIPYIVGTGLPSGTKILIEGILNLEVLPIVGTTATITAAMVDPDTLPTQKTLADTYATPRSLFTSVKKFLGNSVTLDFAEDAANALHPLLGIAVRTARESFGKGRNIRSAANRTINMARNLQAAGLSAAVAEMRSRDDPYEHPRFVSDFHQASSSHAPPPPLTLTRR